jgi:hypothetical protein
MMLIVASSLERGPMTSIPAGHAPWLLVAQLPFQKFHWPPASIFAALGEQKVRSSLSCLYIELKV